MTILLSDSDRRKLEIAEIISNKHGWVSLSELRDQTGASTRALKDDITFFRENFPDLTVRTSEEKGVQFIYKPHQGVNNIFQYVLNHSTSYQFLEAIFLHEGKSVSYFESKHFVSQSTIYRLIKQINEKTASFDMRIETNPLRIVGNEENIRHFFYQYFYTKYSFTSWPFESIDKEFMDKFLDFHIKMTYLNDDFAYLSKFRMIITVNLIRFKHNHLVDTEGLTMDFKDRIPDLTPFAGFFQEIEQAFQITYDEHVIKQLFTPYIDNSFSFSYYHLQQRAQNNEAIANEVALIEGILDRLSAEYEIAIPNRNQVVGSFRNTIHLKYLEPVPEYIFYDRNKYFARTLKENFPDFYASVYREMKTFRKLLNKPDTEVGIEHYIYTVVTYWKGLATALRKRQKKISVIIISDRHVTHSKMIQEFLTHEFPEQVSTKIYEGTQLDQSILESLACDLVVTNFVIPELSNKHTAFIENVPQQTDLLYLQTIFEEIMIEREGGD